VRQRRDLEKAAANHTYLRGLLLLPLGLLLVVAALGNWGVAPFRHAWTFGLAVGALALASLPIARFYDDAYGRINPSTAQQVRGGAAIIASLAVMIGLSSLLRSRAAWSLDLPVNAIAVSFALVVLIFYGLGVGLKTHHLIIWGALLLAGALPVWTGSDPGNVGLVMCGVAVTLSGIFDHRLFVRTFGPAKAPGLQNRDAGA